MKTALFVTGLAIILTACSESVPPENKLFESASDFEEAKNYIKAVETYDSIIKNYPDSPNRYKAIFMKGYIYTDMMKDRKKAIEAFDSLLAEYPDCDLADDAKIMRDMAEKGQDLMSVLEDSLKSK